MDLTVAICTFKREDILPATFESLVQIEKPNVAWELLVVDNDCNDQVKAIVDSFADRLPIRYATESQTGIAHARNRAVEECRSPLIFFADDDVIFNPKWLVNMFLATQNHSDCEFWGGRIDPVFETTPPPWFDMDACPMMGDAIVRYDVGDEPRYWNSNEDPPFYTCNLALRVAAIRDVGMFNTTMGHKGKKRGSGEDSWMVKSISRKGGKGWYAADASLKHPVPSERMSRPFLMAFAKRQGAISVEMIIRQQNESGELEGKAPKWIIRVALEQLIKSTGQWLAGLFTFNTAKRFAGRFRMKFNASKLKNALFGVAS